MERGTKALVDNARELNLPFLKVSEDEGVRNLHGADEQMDPAELIDDDLDNSTKAEVETLVESESATVNTSTFGRMNIRSAETLLLNGGRTNLGALSNGLIASILTHTMLALVKRGNTSL